MKYMTDPKKIKKASLTYIQEQLGERCADLSEHEQSIAFELAHIAGNLEIPAQLLFSESAIANGLKALKKSRNIICDSDTLSCHLKAEYLKQDPLCFTQKPTVISQAKANKQTRGMVAINQWKSHIDKSIILLSDTSAALFHLIERLEDDFAKPALIIAMPSGLVEEQEAKELLWKKRESLGVECIVLQGTLGGSLMVATVMNYLLITHHESLQKSPE
jgi:precorrin-8X/cobalt-precorrin-8 methylmutase